MHAELRDELYCQLIRKLEQQFTVRTAPSLQRAWLLMRFYTMSFPPSRKLHKHLNAFLFCKEMVRVCSVCVCVCVSLSLSVCVCVCV